ncbi:site-specific integrase [Streptomyces sp. W16]|uniref:tyrosine-type recombinase/integrase n=1 Tax=Streptomyces sp. W16 TaxID=3076631 RepID=UPI00295ADF9B|nr:site-specific integrase [Streptomyces sp. W16]MDV9168635.1 site-specific integrase [Streptomyces sp. W16]
MLNGRVVPRDLAGFVLPDSGRLEETGNRYEPYRLLDQTGAVVTPVALWFSELQAAGKPEATLRSYGNDLLRWFRFLWAFGVVWERATRVEARDFVRWMHVADKPVRMHWRHRAKEAAGETVALPEPRVIPAPGSPNPVTGKPAPGLKYAASTRAHCETVLRTFYDFHCEEGTGPLLNPFPLDRSRRGGRAHAHHNPMEAFSHERQGRYRPRVPNRIPRRIPDALFDALFAALRYNRDRALLAAWVSTGARADELLTCRQEDADPGQQLIGVIRKGSREYQELPAAPDAFVWLRLYQQEAWERGVPRGPRLPLWWTLRRKWRPLTYHAARAMLLRVNALLGSNWSLHDVRHTAAYRMARDPQLPLTHVQWVLGHAHLSTTQIYLAAGLEEILHEVRAHHARQAERRLAPPAPPASGYNPASLDVLFRRPM